MKSQQSSAFQLSSEQADQLAKWRYEQDSKVARRQSKDIPYYGCTGGAYTYSFTPTSLGMVVKVKNELTHDEINLTDYDMW